MSGVLVFDNHVVIAIFVRTWLWCIHIYNVGSALLLPRCNGYARCLEATGELTSPDPAFFCFIIKKADKLRDCLNPRIP